MIALLSHKRCGLIAGLALGLMLMTARAFPPAPDHVIFGTVRDEQGVPLNRPNAQVWLEVDGKLVSKATIGPDPAPGVNYRLAIPMDSAIKADLYTPTALRPTVPFRLRVRIGSVTYLPIEMTGAVNLVTRPGASSRVDLTLGVDSDGDGLPDAWEKTLIAAMGGKKSLKDIRPEDDDDGDGLSNLQEYLAGTYAFDPAEGFNLTIVSVAGGRPVLEFLAIRGRSYSIRASSDLEHWTPVGFTMTTDAPGNSAQLSYLAPDTRTKRPVVESSPVEPGQPRFFKLIVN